MKRLLLSIGVAILFSVNALAQDNMHFGVYAGGSVNNIGVGSEFYYDDSEINTVVKPTGCEVSYLDVKDARIHANGGFTIGGLFEYGVNDFFSLQVELLFNQYGYKMTGTVEQQDIADNSVQTYDYKANTIMSDFSGALIGKAYMCDNRISVDLGVQPSFCFRMIKDTERGISHKTVVYTSNKDYTPINLTALAGVTFYFFDNLFLSARYVHGFSDVLKTRKPYLPEGSMSSDDMELHYTDAASKTVSMIFTLGFKM